jgi:lysophospholipase L1-like esterase
MLPWQHMDRRWILGGVLLAGGVGVVRVLTHRPRFDENSQILLIGDSFANGLTPHFQTLATDERLPYFFGAKDGTTIAEWVQSEWLERKLEEFKPSHVLISLGTNDAYSDVSPEQVAEDTAELVSLIQEYQAHPIWIGSPELPDLIGGFGLREEVLDAVQENAPYYYNSSEIVIPRSPDGLHPTATGYAGWAALVWNWLS